MDRGSPYERIRTAQPEQREKIYAEIYDGSAPGGKAEFHQPTARRRGRLTLYSRVIGSGHQALLELGCGSGDLTCALVELAQRVVGIDMSSASLRLARQRADALLPPESARRVEFAQMNAVKPEFPDRSFDYAVSTSMIEHLHPQDVDIHLREVWRVLKPGGHYLVWCPNRLGHHQDRPYHLSMMSYRDLTERMSQAGFGQFRSPLFRQRPMVSTQFKIFMEDALSSLRTRLLWSHLGVRNVLVEAARGS